MSGATWDVERMRPVVLEWDEALRADVPAYARLAPGAEERGSVLRPPATVEEIAAAEDRLGIQFPASHRSCLLISNGAEAGPYRANSVNRLFEPSREELLSIQDVVAFADNGALAWLVATWRDNFQDFANRRALPSPDGPVDVHDCRPGSRAVLVTLPVQDGIVGLVPFPGEWQVWQFFHEHVAAHQSFVSFLAHHAREVRRSVAKRAERVRDGGRRG